MNCSLVILARRGVVAALILLVGGCSSSPRPAPTTVSQGPSYSYFDPGGASDRPVVLIDQLENPARSSVRVRQIGGGMSEVLGKAIRAAGTYDAWVSSRAGRDIRRALDTPPTKRAEMFAQMRLENPRLAYVVLGQVTDFQHVTHSQAGPEEKSVQVSESALVAIAYSVVSLESGRVVMSDHIVGERQSIVGGNGTDYRSVAFGSISFWGTPLGGASQHAIDRVVVDVGRLPLPIPAPAPEMVAEQPAEASETGQVANASEPRVVATNQVVNGRPAPTPAPSPAINLAPAYPDAPAFDVTQFARVERQFELRRLRVFPGSLRALHEGETYYVGRFDLARGRIVAIDDPDTGRPLRARITDVGRTNSVASLIGLAPANANLRGAVLVDQRPPSVTTSAWAGVPAGDSP